MITRLSKRSFHSGGVLCKTVPKKAGGRSTSSTEWLTRQLNDPYVKKAREMGYRARSAFKLIEINEKVKLLKPGMTIVECGACPGAWSQVAVERINSDGKNKNLRGLIIGVDLLTIDPLPGAIFLSNSDFTQPKVQEKIKEYLRSEKSDSSSSVDVGDEPLVDLILSDMAPDACGNSGTDHYRILKLAECALKFALENGKPGSNFLTKLWAGDGQKKFEETILEFYSSCTVIKPKSSRSDSSELFLFAKDKLD